MRKALINIDYTNDFVAPNGMEFGTRWENKMKHIDKVKQKVDSRE